MADNSMSQHCPPISTSHIDVSASTVITITAAALSFLKPHTAMARGMGRGLQFGYCGAFRIGQTHLSM